MKLPWVSREAYEAVQDALRIERENTALLRRELFSRPQFMAMDPEPFVPPQPKPVSPITQVIREQTQNGARVDHRLASHLRTYAEQLKREGKTEDEIVGALVDWQTSEMIETE